MKIHRPKKSFITILSLACIGIFTPKPAIAGFLLMPDVVEPQEAEHDILLKDLDIPSVSFRSPNPEDGPRLNVTAFRVQGIVEFPELGITRKALIDLVENVRVDVMKEDERLYDGYTLEELAELQELIAEIERETRDIHVGPSDVQRLVFLIRDQRRRRGVTLGMLEMVADQITDYYRQRGFVLAKAFIPEQQVRDGIVTITLLLGYLGDVTLENSRRYPQWLVENLFADIRYRPVTTRLIEEKLFFLNDLPGLRVQGFFSPGQQVGDTLLTVNVLQEDLYNVNFRVDNHGSDVTGEYRTYGEVLIHNPLGYGDQLHLAALWATEPETASYGMVRYSGPLLHYRWGFDLSASQNAFVTGMERGASALSIGGRSNTYDLGLRYQINRSRIRTTALNLRATSIRALQNFTTQSAEGVFHKDHLHNVSLNYEFDQLSTATRTAHSGRLGLTHSRIHETLFNTHLRDAWIANLDYTSLRFISLPWADQEYRWVLRGAAQYAGRQTASASQMGLGGPLRVRSHKSNAFFADDVLYAGTELLLDMPAWTRLRPYAQVYLMADTAYGIAHQNDTGGNTTRFRAHLSSLGLGGKFSVGAVRGNLSVARPVSSRIKRDAPTEPFAAYKVYFDMQYSL